MSSATLQSGFFCVLGPRKSNEAFRATFQYGTLIALCSSGKVLGSLVPDSSRVRNTHKRPPTTAGRDFGNPTLAALSAYLSNDTCMSMVRQLVVEFWPFERFGGVTHGLAESPRALSFLCQKTYFWRIISLEQNRVEPSPALTVDRRPHDMHII